MSTTILGIESSCDDTSAAVISDGFLRSNVISSQNVHAAYGGVVPELASRAHQQNIVPTVSEALRQAGVKVSDLDAVAFTRGPGLLGSLLVGTSFAKSLAIAARIPTIDVNHLHAHILSHFIRTEEGQEVPEFPFICLLVSGGNSQIVMVRSPYDMEIAGRTIDDAAGEAFDKCAKVMGLPYPGGPHRPSRHRRESECIPVQPSPHTRTRLLILRTKDIFPLHASGQSQNRSRIHRKPQSRPCRFATGHHHPHPPRQT